MIRVCEFSSICIVILLNKKETENRKEEYIKEVVYIHTHIYIFTTKGR